MRGAAASLRSSVVVLFWANDRKGLGSLIAMGLIIPTAIAVRCQWVTIMLRTNKAEWQPGGPHL